MWWYVTTYWTQTHVLNPITSAVNADNPTTVKWSWCWKFGMMSLTQWDENFSIWMHKYLCRSAVAPPCGQSVVLPSFFSFLFFIFQASHIPGQSLWKWWKPKHHVPYSVFTELFINFRRRPDVTVVDLRVSTCLKYPAMINALSF